MKFDLDAAVAKNATLLALSGVPINTQKRIAMWMADWQDERGIEPDGAYDMSTERSTNVAIAEMLGVPFPPSPNPAPPGTQGFTNVEVVMRWRADVDFAALHHDDGLAEYGLGHGASWREPSVFSKDGKADCSAFICHGIGVDKAGRWNTDGMVGDAFRYERGFFVRDAQGKKIPGRRKLWLPVANNDVRPGDVMVYPGPDRDHDGEREGAGHCMGVVHVKPGFVMYREGWEDEVELAHCRWTRYAARITHGSYADKPGVVVVRCRAVVYA